VNSIRLNNVSKKFGRQEIFSGISEEITGSSHLAIIGYNGSGKSTLLQILAGYITPSTGHLTYQVNGREIPTENISSYISFSAPYLDLIEEFTALETIEFYRTFKRIGPAYTNSWILETAMLGNAMHKQVRFFSSGMKQRLKLMLALISDVEFVFLDEPVSNLDKPGIAWYREIAGIYGNGKILIISSNELKEEMDFCNKVLRIEDYKTG
jgi:ABC-type multidrug transport system ATPase subunit